jgi:hypothetical protein
MDIAPLVAAVLCCNNNEMLKKKKKHYLHNRPRVLLNSALCNCGYWSANCRLAS